MNQPTRAVIDALEAPTGAIPNGRFAPAPRRPAQPNETGFSPVEIVQPAAGRWGCDGCGKRGYGGSALLEHSSETNFRHRVFTPIGA